MKSKRQACILEIIRTRRIETQDELIGALEKSGFQVTQATVSRDIKELRLVKTLDNNGVYHYTVATSEKVHISSRFNSIFQDAVRSVEPACNLVVVKCIAGMAQAACAAMDSLHWETLIGTLAGEDTFVCITKSEADAVALAEELKKLQRPE
ncbi:MAG: arginine repressor [Clostridia bacterium]|nr:arginine repressor [Clostridia bacterium]